MVHTLSRRTSTKEPESLLRVSVKALNTLWSKVAQQPTWDLGYEANKIKVLYPCLFTTNGIQSQSLGIQKIHYKVLYRNRHNMLVLLAFNDRGSSMA